MPDHEIKYYSYHQGAFCTAIVSDEGYQEMCQKYEELKDTFDPSTGITCAEDYMRTILSLHY